MTYPHSQFVEVRQTVLSCLTINAAADNISILICTALLNRVPTSSNSQNAITYGSYVGLSMATGFLFLSGGMRTFGTSIEDGTQTNFTP